MTLIILPAYNEELQISKVIDALREHGFSRVVVINDGSTDNTELVATKCGAKVLNHAINQGLGAALSTGLESARKNNFDHVITVDSDGQHLIEDVIKIKNELVKGKYDVVIGSRLADMKAKHKARYYLNVLSDILTSILSGFYVQDTQSGLRGFNKKAINTLKLNSKGYEVSSEIIIKAVKAGLKIKTVPIQAIYTDYSLKKGQQIGNALRVFRKLLLQLLP